MKIQVKLTPNSNQAPAYFETNPKSPDLNSQIDTKWADSAITQGHCGAFGFGAVGKDGAELVGKKLEFRFAVKILIFVLILRAETQEIRR